MQIEWSCFGVSPQYLIDNTVRQCAYHYYQRHGIPQQDIRILTIRFFDIHDDIIEYEAEIEYDENKLTEHQLSMAGIGDR